MNEPVLRLKNVSVSFGPQEVLRDLNLDIAAGDTVAVIGESGCGKTVLLKLVVGLLAPTAGDVLFGDQAVQNLSAKQLTEMRRRIGFLFQSAALFDSLRVWENVAFGLIQGDRMARGAAKDVALRKLGAVGLDGQVSELYPSELSGGMQKRVALARAIAREPEIIFFDEPTTGLDPIMSDVINKLIVKCVRDLGATAVSITHDMVSARHIADRIAMIYEGRIIWNGAAKEIDRSGNGHVDQFLHGRAEGPIAMPVRPL